MTGIVTDSAANLPRELRDRYGIVVVPIHLFLDGKLYRDEEDLTCAGFYAWLKAAPDLAVSTSSPPPGDFLRAYDSLAQQHEEIVSLHIASGLSGTFAAAREAAGLVRSSHVELVDTRSVSMGEGFCVLAAARTIEAGGSAEDAAAAARGVAARVELYALLETLRYVARTGRVPALAAHAGSMLHLHPVIAVSEGRADLRGIERSKPRATRRLVETTVDRLGGKAAHVAVMHADAADEAQALAETLRATCDCVELIVTQFTPVMGASTGPGLLAVAFYPDDISARSDEA